MLALLALPQSGSGSIAKLTHALGAPHVLLVVLDVREASHGGHAGAIEGKLPLGGQLHHDLVIELSQNGTKCSCGMDEMTRLAGILLEAVNPRSYRQGTQRVGISLIGTHC